MALTKKSKIRIVVAIMVILIISVIAILATVGAALIVIIPIVLILISGGYLFSVTSPKHIPEQTPTRMYVPYAKILQKERKIDAINIKIREAQRHMEVPAVKDSPVRLKTAWALYDGLLKQRDAVLSRSP